MSRSRELADALREAVLDVDDPDVAWVMVQADEWLRKVSEALSIYGNLENGVDIRCRMWSEDKAFIEDFWEDEDAGLLQPCEELSHRRARTRADRRKIS